MLLVVFFLLLRQNMTRSGKNYITTLTDEELLEKQKESANTEYFGALYNRYTPLLYGMALKYLQDDNKASEAVTALFEELRARIGNEQIEQFKAWLYKAAHQYFLQTVQKETPEAHIEFHNKCAVCDELMNMLCKGNEDHERKQTLLNSIGRLPDGQRICIIHFFMNGMSYADIADKTGYSLQTVRNNIANGKQNLRNSIYKHLK